MSGIRYIVSDIDETFVSSSKELLPENLRAIEEARAAGIGFAFATGRYWPSLKKLTTLLHLHLPQLVDNGAVVVEPDTERVLAQTVVDGECQRFFYERLRQSGFYPVFCDGKAYHAAVMAESTMRQMASHQEYVDILPEAQLFSQLASYDKLVVFAQERCDELEHVSAEIITAAHERHFTFNPVFTEAGIFVITAEGVNKGSGLDLLCSVLGCSLAEIATIGDGNNDVEMLARAGRSFAVANATAAAKQSATDIVASNDEAGFAQAIRTILTNKRGKSA